MALIATIFHVNVSKRTELSNCGPPFNYRLAVGRSTSKRLLEKTAYSISISIYAIRHSYKSNVAYYSVRVAMLLFATLVAEYCFVRDLSILQC